MFGMTCLAPEAAGRSALPTELDTSSRCLRLARGSAGSPKMFPPPSNCTLPGVLTRTVLSRPPRRRVNARPRLEASSNALSPNVVRHAPMPRRSHLSTGLVQQILRGIPYRTFRANVERARSELRRHRLQPRRSHYRFLRIGETLRPSRFHRRAVEFVVL
jgi:hypothetical protein